MRATRLLPFVFLAACGQSGDLYLPPEQPAEPVAAPPAAEPVAAPPVDEKKEPPKAGLQEDR